MVEKEKKNIFLFAVNHVPTSKCQLLSWVFGAEVGIRMNDSSNLHSWAKMVVQLHCLDALKALPCLTGHENVPSAHFGHRALQTFNWTIMHKKKKQIISLSYYLPPPAPQKAVWFQLFSLLRCRRFVCTGSPGGHDSSPDVLRMDFISGPHTAAKCASELFSCVLGSVSWSPKPRKLQCSQAVNMSGIHTACC